MHGATPSLGGRQSKHSTNTNLADVKQAAMTKEIPTKTEDVGEMLSSEHTQQKAENRAVFRILQIIWFITRQMQHPIS